MPAKTTNQYFQYLLNFLRQRYFDDPELDAFNRALLSFPAYNAGPARVRGLRRKAEEAGLDPNKWGSVKNLSYFSFE